MYKLWDGYLLKLIAWILQSVIDRSLPFDPSSVGNDFQSGVFD